MFKIYQHSHVIFIAKMLQMTWWDGFLPNNIQYWGHREDQRSSHAPPGYNGKALDKLRYHWNWERISLSLALTTKLHSLWGLLNLPEHLHSHSSPSPEKTEGAVNSKHLGYAVHRNEGETWPYNMIISCWFCFLFRRGCFILMLASVCQHTEPGVRKAVVWTCP